MRVGRIRANAAFIYRMIHFADLVSQFDVNANLMQYYRFFPGGAAPLSQRLSTIIQRLTILGSRPLKSWSREDASQKWYQATLIRNGESQNKHLTYELDRGASTLFAYFVDMLGVASIRNDLPAGPNL